jgi:hypothetical protein
MKTQTVKKVGDPMKLMLTSIAALSLVAWGTTTANAQLINGNLDVTYQQEIVPGFFLPKPASWINVGFRSVSGAYEDEMSSEPWAGPAPTPVTTGGIAGDDWAVFFKPFTGNVTDGSATGHLYQDNPATPGLTYRLTGWAGAEANVLMADAVFALEFLDAGASVIGGSVLSLMPTLFTPNGQPFNYKQYSVSATAPAGTVSVRARASMIDALSNPAGGGQAFVVDDFVLGVPEPTTAALVGLGLTVLVGIRRRS